MQPSAETLEPGTVLAGKLRIIRVIGEGGMGAVYEVEHEFTKHRRALKLLHPAMAAASGIVTRFLREASAAGRIGNPHIVETFDAGTLETGEPYIVMELLDGKPLGEVIARRGRLDFGEALEIIQQACEGIQAAHEAGIVHRDLKPDNLLLLAGDRTFVKILDFGISKFDPARTMDNKLTQDGATLGTPYYMSPEQVRGEGDVDGRSDVYALGVVLYECLTGHKPFTAETLPAIAVLIHEGKYRPLRADRPDAPPALEAALARAINVDRDARYSTPAALAQALATVDVSAAALSAGRRLVAQATEADGTPLAVIGARGGDTMAMESTVPAATASVPAGTDAGVASDARRPEPRGIPKFAWLVAGVVLLGLGALLVWRMGVRDEPASVASEPPAPASIQVTATATVAPPPPVAPQVSVTPLLPSAPAPGVASVARPGRHAVEGAPIAAPSASAKSSRANEHGLAEDNPFQ